MWLGDPKSALFREEEEEWKPGRRKLLVVRPAF